MHQMILRISIELKEKLKKAADERGQTLTGLIYNGLEVIRQGK